MGGLWKDSGYVFVNPTNGGPLNSNAIYDVFKQAAEAAGLPDAATPHTLRHSCASFLHAEGASIKKISVYLGHANTTITNNVYLHLFQGELDDAAAGARNGRANRCSTGFPGAHRVDGLGVWRRPA